MSDGPARYELEVSVFGPGIGECVVAHLGDGAWIVVDSCVHPRSKVPIAIDYLESLSVDIATQVRLVVATHWHDDHIKGLAETFEKAASAKFVNSAAYPLHQLTRLVSVGNWATPQSSATREYAAIFKILSERRGAGERSDAVGPIRALANRAILSLPAGTGRVVDAAVHALSPSDAICARSEEALSRALSVVNEKRRPAAPGANEHSVVLWLKIGVLDVLLGADLEHVPGSNEGWKDIIGSTARPLGMAFCFKVPHHGSTNADCPDCWTGLLREKPIAVVTPYSRSGLPRTTDLDRLCSRTSDVYLTSDASNFGLPRRENAVEKTLREVAVAGSRKAITGQQIGHVRVRCDARELGAVPNVAVFEGAKRRCA